MQTKMTGIIEVSPRHESLACYRSAAVDMIATKNQITIVFKSRFSVLGSKISLGLNFIPVRSLTRSPHVEQLQCRSASTPLSGRTQQDHSTFLGCQTWHNLLQKHTCENASQDRFGNHQEAARVKPGAKGESRSSQNGNSKLHI